MKENTTSFVTYYKILPLEREWKQPEDKKYVNYCGPGATQVALDVRLPASEVPSLDEIGQKENIDPSWGVYMVDVARTLNEILKAKGDIPNANGFQSYWVRQTTSKGDFSWRVKWDIDRGYATIAGVKTGGMPGWSHNSFHIVAIYGMVIESDVVPVGAGTEQINEAQMDVPQGKRYWVVYAETASQRAGYTGTFQQWATVDTFYGWHTRNNVIAW